MPNTFIIGAYASLRASGKKADLALVVCDTDAVVGGTFTQNVMCAAPVLYCKDIMARKTTVRAVCTTARLALGWGRDHRRPRHAAAHFMAAHNMSIILDWLTSSNVLLKAV